MNNEKNEEFESKGSKKKVIIITVIIILAFLLLLAYRIVTNLNTDEDTTKLPVNIKTTTAEISNLYSTSPISGRIQPVEEVSIVPLASGQVKTVYVKLGDRVSKGTVLFDIDNGSLGVSLNQSSDALANAKINYERISLLYEEGAVPLQQYEQAKSQLISAQTGYDTTMENLSNYTVTSPIAGYVTSINVAAGGMASGAGGAAATIADTSELLIKTTISEYLIGKINVGDSVEIFVKSLSTQPFKGKIKEIAPAPATGSLTYPIVISVISSDKEIKAGMFAEIKVVSDKRNNVLCVPSDAIIIKQGVSQIAVLENNLPVFKEIESGLDNGELTEIISGINPGDIVIIEGQHFVVEGEPVEIIQ